MLSRSTGLATNIGHIGHIEHRIRLMYIGQGDITCFIAMIAKIAKISSLLYILC